MPEDLVALANHAAQVYDLDPRLFAAMINVESGFQSHEVSPAGAAGIAQFMEPTWQGVIDAHPELVRDYGANRDPNGRFNPTAALYVSAAHLSDLLRSAGGDYGQALGAYYAGFNGRNSAAGVSYARLVMGRVEGTVTATPSAVAAASTGADHLQHIQRATEQTRREVLDPVRGIVERARATSSQRSPSLEVPGDRRPTEPTVSPTAQPRALTIPDLQRQESILAAVQRARRTAELAKIGESPPVSRAQLGGLVRDIGTGLRDVAGAVGEAVAPVARPILRGLELEQQFVGRPIAKTAIAATPLRFLPEPARRVTEDIASTILVPSTLLFPQIGRAVTVGSVLSRFGLRSLAHPSRFQQEYASARLVLGSVFPNQRRLAAQVDVAARFAAAEKGPGTRLASAEKVRAQLTKAKENLEKLRPGATQEVRGFGRVLGTVDREKLELRIGKLEGRLGRIQQQALQDVRLRLESVAVSSDPAILEAVNKTESALQDIAAFNVPSRYSPMRLAFWRKHVTGYSDEMDQSFRWLISDLPEHAPAQIAEAGEEAVANWRSSLEWIYNLGAEGAFDPKANPGTVFNWAIRASEPLRQIPLIGRPAAATVGGIGRFFQPIGGLEQPVAGALISASRYRRASLHHYMQRRSMMEMAVQAKYGKGLAGEAVDILKQGYKGPTIEQRVDKALSNYKAFQATKGITFDDAALTDMRQMALKVFRESVGTVEDAFRHQDFYELDDEGRRLFSFMDDALTSDRDSASAFGVSIGRINGDYLPQRRVAGEAMKLGTAGRVTYPRSFRSRKIEEWDDFMFAAAIDGQDVERNITSLLDWRLGQAAEKKSFQVITKMLASNDETARFVERPLLSRVKGPIQTRSDEFRNALSQGLKRDFDPETADTIAGEIIARMPEKLSIQEAEFLMGKEFRLRAASEFTEAADQATARQLEGFFKGGRTVDVDENFVGRSLEAMRSMLLSMDLSPVAFVQGARLFAQDPISYTRAIGSGAAWQMTQHGRRVWAIQNAPSLRFAARHGLQLGHPLDIRIDLARKPGESLAGWMGRRVTSGVLPPFDWLNNEMMHTVGAAKLHIFNSTYATLLAAQRNPELWGLLKGHGGLPLIRNIAKANPGWNALAEDDLARAVAQGMNNYIGPVEFSAITADARPSFLERMTILTPSWTRGNIGLIMDAPKAGVKGVMARHLLMNQFALQTSLATKLSLSLSGKMPSFDPTSTDFLAVQAPDFRFQLFPTMSAIRTPFRLLAGRPEGQQFKEEAIWKERGRELTRFFEGRMAQGPRIMADLLQGEDFLGRKIDSQAQFVMKELSPIIVQELWESMDEGHIPPGEVAQRAGLEFMGAQVIPKTPFQLYREQAELLTGQPFDQINSVEKKRLEQAHPELVELRDRQRAYRARRGDALDQFFNMAEDTRVKSNKAINIFLDAKHGQPGSFAEYAQLSGQELALIGERSDAAIEALFGTREDFEAALRSRPVVALDEAAHRYWALSPDDFVDTKGNRWNLQQGFLEVDPDAYRDELWRAFRETRDAQLSQAAREFGLPQERIEQYVLRDWPSVRWRDPRAADLESRRVGAQRSLDQLFETSPYRFLGGQEFTPEQLRRTRELRVSIEQILSPLRASFQSGGADLPTGSKQMAIARVLGETTNDEDKKLLIWLMFWERETFRDFLRNPRRDLILTENPDAIKFYPERVRFLLSTRLLNTPLGNDPEVVRIIQSALAR